MLIVQPSVELLDFMGSDLSVVNAARVSFHKESEYDPIEINHGEFTESTWTLKDSDARLISYLSKHGHWSPFAHTSLTFRISAPIFVARQLVKHQVGGVWNEVSRRYVDEEPEFYFPEVFHSRPGNVKQGCGEILEDKQEDLFLSTYTEWATGQALYVYKNLLNTGMAPEEARMFLPQNTMTEWWWTGSLMFFARVCKQRLDSHAQNATRSIAQLIHDHVPKEFTVSWKALMNE